MTVHVSGAAIQFEIAESGKALSELVTNAGRKRRVFDEELAEKTLSRRRCIVLAAVCAFMASAIGGASLFNIEATPYFVIGTIIASAVSGLAAVVILLMDHSPLYSRLQGDTARCDTIIRMMKSMRQNDAHATVLGRDVLLTLSKEFKKIADSYETLDETEFEVFEWRSSDVQRFKIKRFDRIKPRHSSVNVLLDNGERRSGRIKDLSRSGVAILMEAVLDRGSLVTIGSTPARMVRTFDKGMAFEFVTPIPDERFSKSMRL